MSDDVKPMIRVGSRVRLDSPYGRLVRGDLAGAFLVVPNGSLGDVVGASGTGSVVVQWDAIGGTVGVSVAEHWLTEVTL